MRGWRGVRVRQPRPSRGDAALAESRRGHPHGIGLAHEIDLLTGRAKHNHASTSEEHVAFDGSGLCAPSEKDKWNRTHD